MAQGQNPDEALLARVRPPGHVQPTPLPRYDLVVLGGGAAGLVSAMGAAGLGARVALVERERLGGDCLNTGCVPSKALLRAARAAHEARGAARLGIHAQVQVDFPTVMGRVREVRAQLARHDSVERFEGAGVHVFFGEARFAGPDLLRIGPTELRFRRAILATGSSPRSLPGFGEALTTDTIWSLDTLPARLLVIGGGPVGVELAQAFARLGSEVTLAEAGPRILPREAPDAAAWLVAQLEREGVRVRTNVAPGSAGLAAAATHTLLAIGRTPRLEGLGLEEAGVRIQGGALVLDEHLATTNPRIFAAGDVTGLAPTTHGADAMARVALRNALFPGWTRFDPDRIPRSLWTDPELAQLGPVDAEGARVELPFGELDRAELEDRDAGWMRLVLDERNHLLAATILGERAGDLVAFLSHIRSQKLPLHALSGVSMPYPSFAAAIARAADQASRRRLSPTLARVLAYFARRGA